MKIRIAKAFNGYKVGQQFDWGDGMARVMIARGLVVAVDEAPAVERAVLDREVERSVVQQQVKRKGK
jgi:hypothetical protein